MPNVTHLEQASDSRDWSLNSVLSDVDGSGEGPPPFSQEVSRVYAAVGSMFEVSFDGSNVVIWPRFREGHIQIPVGALSDVEIRMPKPLASGGLRLTVPGDDAVDGVKVDFHNAQAGAFAALHQALLAAIQAGPAELHVTRSHTGDPAVLSSLRTISSLSDLEFGVRRNELLAEEMTPA